MVVADAVIHGDVDRHLRFDARVEQPVALQIGGSEPAKLVQAAKLGAEYGYDEINMNVGCPSDRVQSGTFGACLMREPDLVAQCVDAMKQAVDVPVTVKCRIGVDDQDAETALSEIAQRVFDAGCDGLWVHARKAWLQGLSPKENRDVPPLDYDRVIRLKADHPNRFIGINGGVVDLKLAKRLGGELDGVMLGRAAYQNPALLAGVDASFYDVKPKVLDVDRVEQAMREYAQRHIAEGGRLHHVTRHMIGLFHGRPGARRYRQILSVEASKPGARPDIISAAFAAVQDGADTQAA